LSCIRVISPSALENANEKRIDIKEISIKKYNRKILDWLFTKERKFNHIKVEFQSVLNNDYSTIYPTNLTL